MGPQTKRKVAGMSGSVQFTIGSEVSCSDGPGGTLKRVVIDPVAKTLTHLVVGPKHGGVTDHLVPVALAVPRDKGITLTCTVAELGQMEEAEETQFIPGGNMELGYGQEEMMSWPYYGLGVGAYGMGGLRTGMGVGGTVMPAPQMITNDRVPTGDVEVRRGEHVFATDGAIGHVQGLVINPGNHLVTHVLLDEGHLWGQKRVAIPISAVASTNDGVRLNLTKDQVRDLPEIELDEKA